MKHKLARSIVKARRVLLAIMVLAAVLGVLGISKTKINYDLTRYLSDNTMTKRSLAVMEEEFGSSEQLRVMFRDLDEQTLQEYASQINALDGVLFAAHDPETGTKTEDGHVWQLVSATLSGGDASEIVIKLREMFPEAGEYYVGGSAANQLDVQRSVGKEMPEVMLIAVAVVLIVLLLTSHAWLEPVVILIVLAVSIVINMGTNFVFRDVSFITFAVCAILQLALSIDYAVMLLHSFNGLRDGGAKPEEAMAQALEECFMRITSSAFTTIAGLLSLLFMSFTIGFDIGLVLSKGILLSLLSVFAFMPALTLLMEKGLSKTKHRPINLHGERLGGFIVRFRRPIAVGMVLAVLCGLYFNSRNTYTFSNDDYQSSGASGEISKRFGASNALVFLLLGGEEDADYDLQRELTEKLLSVRMKNGEAAISSVSAMVTTGAAALEYYTPEEVAGLTGMNVTVVKLFFTLQGFGDSVRADKLLDAAASLSEDNEEIAQLQAQLATARSAFIGKSMHRLLAEVAFPMTDPDMKSYMEALLGAADETYGDNYYVTGMPMSNYDIANAFQSDLVRVNLITLIAILLIVMLSFRSVTLPVLLVLVIEGAIWITMGLSALIGQPIFFISYLICLSIQMGATIDYAILLSDRYRALRRAGESAPAALRQAMRTALNTILTSGIILIVAGYTIGRRCSIFYIYSIGLLVSRGALVSVLLVLTLLPALLLTCDRFVVGRKTSAQSRQMLETENE